MRRHTIIAIAFLSPWLLGFSLFLAVPLGLAGYYSFCDYSLTTAAHPPVWIGWENFRELRHDPLFWQSLLNTLYFAALTLPSGLLLSFGLALILNVGLPGQAVYRTLIYLPSLIPATASATIWVWILNSRLGLFNSLLGRLHVPPVNWLSERWAMPSLALISLWGTGNAVVIYLAGLDQLPRDVYEAAEIDGATPWQRLVLLTIPLLSPLIFFNLIFSLIGAFSTLTLPYMVTRGGPNNATYLYTMYSYDVAFSFLRMGYACALAGVQLVIVLALTFVALWCAKRWTFYE